ncbi:MAG: ABC transporter permease subunit [Symploca sp. SIO3C6]|uniref:ABC transporter permease subunit n=1 Tax=Symploca sp. SIO1C4 TaxID=2607765 RepID=A0A6B3NDF8_9CYAN|nr:ABC transporter permease subunit [Symploca sp. SIO3C6]NER31606.1 ABC transporter permease subunit [Symploca sp. SIO1C4]NET04019.1 ABC transporter permease subunit [Symploca sp. SIO2B6]
MSWGRIWVIASNGFREVIRDRILYIIGLFALLLIIAQRLLQEVAASTLDKIIIDFGLAAIGILGALIAVFVGTGLINKEIEKRTLLVLIPKPLNRAELIIGKHLGLSAVIAVCIGAMTIIYLGVLSFFQIDYPLGSILVSIFYQFLELSLITAIALLFGVFTSSLLAALLSFGVYLMGKSSRDLLELGKLSDDFSIQMLTQCLYLVLPDLSRLNLKNEAVYALLPPPQQLVSNGLYALFYTGLVLAIAIFIFSLREF